MSRIAPLAVLALCLVATAGCRLDAATEVLVADSARSIEPGDFVGDASADATAQINAVEPVNQAEAPDAEVALASPLTPTETVAPSVAAIAANVTDEPVAVDGMIGQINGRPVYADDVLADLADGLRARGRQLPRAAFENEAKQSITEAVRATLQSRLILAEAERSLTEAEWNGVRFMREQRRSELLRLHGMGSIKAADRVLLADTGRGLEETLERYQDGLITQTYINRNLLALINVTRRDIERFYRDNLDRFQPPTTRDVTVIVVDTDEAADSVRSQLDSGVEFAAIASDAAINALPNGGRLEALRGFGRDEVDTPLFEAEPGDWFGPVPVSDGRLWFVRLEALNQGEQVSLEDAQAGIERALREQQRSLKTEQFLKRLSDEGNFTDPETMIETLTRIAMSRYAAG